MLEDTAIETIKNKTEKKMPKGGGGGRESGTPFLPEVRRKLYNVSQVLTEKNC